MTAYRAVSLDLWFTTCSYERGYEGQWRRDRLRELRSLVVARDGARFELEQLERASAELRAHSPHSDGRGYAHSPPLRFVEDLATHLGGRLTTPREEAGRRYSRAGLREHPPRVNPEIRPLVAALQRKGVSVMFVTNTGRMAQSWEEFLRDQGVPPPFSVVTSCETGWPKPDPRIFWEAARRLGADPAGLLHVGDRWELDIKGARAAGCGAVLYRGLWHDYPEEEGYSTAIPDDGGDPVPVIEHLGELLSDDRWSLGSDRI